MAATVFTPTAQEGIARVRRQGLGFFTNDSDEAVCGITQRLSHNRWRRCVIFGGCIDEFEFATCGLMRCVVTSGVYQKADRVLDRLGSRFESFFPGDGRRSAADATALAEAGGAT